MQENNFNHDHFNTWQSCPERYYFKYIKKLDWPDFTGDYELGQKVHALIDYQLRGFNVDKLLNHASDEIKNCRNLIKDYPLLKKELVKTEWGFNSRIKNTNNWLIGRIDAIFYDCERNKFIIADWKTGKYIPKNVETNFQHKIYLYAFYNCRQDLNLDFKPEQLEFQYVKITEGVTVTIIEFSEEKLIEYENQFLNNISKIQEKICFSQPENCPAKECIYKNLCFK